jgi:hypothetical protein
MAIVLCVRDCVDPDSGVIESSGMQKLVHMVRRKDRRPFFFTVSVVCHAFRRVSALFQFVCEPDALINTPLSMRPITVPSVNTSESSASTMGQLIAEADRVDEDIRKAADSVFQQCCDRTGHSALSADDFRQLVDGEWLAILCVRGVLSTIPMRCIGSRLSTNYNCINGADVSKVTATNGWKLACDLTSSKPRSRAVLNG